MTLRGYSWSKFKIQDIFVLAFSFKEFPLMKTQANTHTKRQLPLIRSLRTFIELIMIFFFFIKFKNKKHLPSVTYSGKVNSLLFKWFVINQYGYNI